MKDKTELYVRNIIFGVTDSLVSTVGLLSGIDVTGASRQTIIATGIIYAFVEAFSMAVGSFLSEESSEEYEAKGEVNPNRAFLSGVIMFVSFVVASFVPIFPYLIFSLSNALWMSIIFSILLLFILGLISSRFSRVNMGKHALKMAFLGGMAIVIGVLVGKFLHLS